MNNKILLDGHALDEVTIKNSKMKPSVISLERNWNGDNNSEMVFYKL